MVENLANMDSSYVRNLDSLVRDTVINSGGAIQFNWSNSSLVFTIGDRYASFMDILRAYFDPEYKNTLYADWFQHIPNGIPYKSPKNSKVGRYSP